MALSYYGEIQLSHYYNEKALLLSALGVLNFSSMRISFHASRSKSKSYK